jgi:DALR anticodon binding domain
MQLDKNIAVIQYPSLTQWLMDRFAAAISASEPMVNVPQDFMALPLFTCSGHSLGTFSSPLLLKLSRGEGVLVAQNLGAQILQTFAQHSKPEEFNPKLWVHPEGWLYADFDSNNLAKFLQHLTTAEPTLLAVASPRQVSEISSPTISSDPVLFKLQYAHARCCSLLRLAHQEKFLPFDNLEHYFKDCGTSLWQTDSGELRLQTKAEQALLLALLQFPQSLSPQKVAYGCCTPTVPGAETRVMWPLPPAHLRKQAMAWGQLFSNFYSDCRLFGDIQTHEPQLATARFALVLILKKVLAFVLEDILQMTAPLTL